MTQNEMILKHITVFGGITSLEAFRDYGCTRLSARIADLKSAGYEFESIRRTSVNRFGDKVSFTEYRLKNGRAQDVCKNNSTK